MQSHVLVHQVIPPFPQFMSHMLESKRSKRLLAVCVAFCTDARSVAGTSPSGAGFIRVHNLLPVSALIAEPMVDPIQDLVPVCPKCHAMIHYRTPPFDIEQLRRLLRESDRS